MNASLRKDADQIVRESIAAVLPDEAVRRTLRNYSPGTGKTLLVAAGKAAWQMAKAAVDTLGQVDGGVVITKYGHVLGEIPGVVCCEAGHPVPDENSFAATKKALELVENRSAGDTVVFLLSGGYVDGETCAALGARGISVFDVLKDNDAYHALQAVSGLIVTGPTGTNVNDVAVALLCVK